MAFQLTRKLVIQTAGLVTAIGVLGTASIYCVNAAVEYVGGPDAPYAGEAGFAKLALRVDSVERQNAIASQLILDLKKADCIRDQSDAAIQMRKDPDSQEAQMDYRTATTCIRDIENQTKRLTLP